MALYAPIIVSFDLDPPPRYSGTDNKRRAWQAFFAAHAGSIGYEVRELDVTTDGGGPSFAASIKWAVRWLLVAEVTYGYVGPQASNRSMASGWLSTITCQYPPTSGRAVPF